MSRESDKRAEYLASLAHTGRTMQEAEAEAARIEAEGILPTGDGNHVLQQGTEAG